MKTLLFVVVFSIISLRGHSLPQPPNDSEHPGSQIYLYDVAHHSFSVEGRRVDVYLPNSKLKVEGPFPVIVFGHGQALDHKNFEASFKHFAKKGIAVIHPMYDRGFFDRKWRRMANDFNSLTSYALNRFSDKLDSSRIVYSGHSKGAYVALMAAGEPQRDVHPRSLVLFAPSGIDSEYMKSMDALAPLTLVWATSDSVIKKNLMEQIYTESPSLNKQLIQVRDYESFEAGHFFVLTKKSVFGGRTGISPYHYYGMWKWLIGATWDLDKSVPMSSPYIYGDLTGFSGIRGQDHQVNRSW